MQTLFARYPLTDYGKPPRWCVGSLLFNSSIQIVEFDWTLVFIYVVVGYGWLRCRCCRSRYSFTVAPLLNARSPVYLRWLRLLRATGYSGWIAWLVGCPAICYRTRYAVTVTDYSHPVGYVTFTLFLDRYRVYVVVPLHTFLILTFTVGSRTVNGLVTLQLHLQLRCRLRLLTVLRFIVAVTVWL